MMKNVKFVLLLFSAFLAFNTLTAQQKSGMVKKQAATTMTEKTETFKVLGNCGMCQKTIQAAATQAGATKAYWNMQTDEMQVTFDPAKTSVDGIQKAIAQAGYDNAGYKAPDNVYDNLHGCCKYDRTGAAGSTKSCEEQ